ncbi:hypothetical protein PLICRDRAFT_178954 [Plicaturopsis crispa FD-325 SS-3]|uniref:BTB domain-containing protein n=1 Tax=Plicaturopsis crispa FD-325 SS-3 TaxID=944288 RepID=A0A0C9SLB9_PLICR|nr:hypothetical protein PLICRDRAFT_178954 [Plicaturopsis crispa FD-325 SS-3]
MADTADTPAQQVDEIASIAPTSPRVHRHPSFYIPDGTHVFRVGSTCYKLHAGVLCSVSATFVGMFGTVPTSSGGTSEGQTDEAPICIPDSEPFTELNFEMLLTLLYPGCMKMDDRTPISRYLGLLRIGLLLQCKIAQDAAKAMIWKKRYYIGAVDMVDYAREFSIRAWLEFGFASLIDISNTSYQQLSEDHFLRLGMPFVARMCYARESLERHLRIVACEPPSFTHAPDCTSNMQCDEDWRAVWWNIMGRCLLDGRAPKTWEGAVERLTGSEFGNMPYACVQAGMNVVRGGKAFHVGEAFAANAAEEFAREMIVYEDMED